MPNRKKDTILLKVRDDIIVNINNIDCIVYTNEDPSKNGSVWKDGKKHYIMYFNKGCHFSWAVIPDEDYEQIKDYIK